MGAGNVVSGNRGNGISTYTDTDDLIAGNKIGTDITGTVALPNRYGVVIGGLSSDITIGGTVAGAGNLISGNSEAGVWIDGDVGQPRRRQHDRHRHHRHRRPARTKGPA